MEVNINPDEEAVSQESQLPVHTQEKEKFPTDPLLEPVAKAIIENSLQIKPGDRLLILMDPTGWQLAGMVTQRARENKAEVNIRLYSSEISKQSLEGLQNTEHPAALPLGAEKTNITPENRNTAFIHYGAGTDQLDDAIWANKYLIIRNKIPSGQTYDVDAHDQQIYDEVEAMVRRFRNDDREKRWALVYEPNEEEAQQAGITLAEYRKVYYEAIDRPWEEVEQAHQVLIDFLADKKTFQVQSPAPADFPPQWQTDVTMSIEGMRGLSSTIGTNLPGSEVMTAPVVETLTGSYAIPYPVMMRERILPNIRLEFTQGKVSSYDVHYADPNDPQRQKDLEFIRTLLEKDDGASGVGELGIGTNPNIDKPYLNTLLIEKAGGSIHLALGNSYPNKGDAVIDNGNRSTIHVDLTRMLLPEYGGGTISVDGQVIQQDGRFLLPGLEILNKQPAQ